MKTCVDKNVKDYDKVISFLLLIFQSEQCNFFIVIKLHFHYYFICVLEGSIIAF